MKSTSIFLALMTFSSVTFAAQYQVKVNIVVLKNSKDQGNTKWTNTSYVNGFLQQASLKDPKADFSLKSLSIKKDDKLYNSLDQLPALNLATNLARKSEITVVITNENTNKSAGLAWDRLRYNPVLAMRSRNYGSDQYSTNVMALDAAIFLHELGHNMGLAHTGAINTDNFYRIPAGINFADKYYEKLVGKLVAPPTKPTKPIFGRQCNPRTGICYYEK